MAQQRYQVLERIDAGGMAEVFKANSTSIQGFQKLVAIKRILPDLTKNERFVRMFLDEAKVSLHLNHTNIVQVFDLGMADGTYFIVMEFVDGTNLKKIIQGLGERRQRLSVEQAVYIGLEVCKGLSHAHYKKDQKENPLSIVHRDISPPNVLMSREGEVKITDFGLAKAKSQAEITDPGVVKGKFGYLSPEAASGEDVDPRTDLFAVGILMWEMLAGRRLFLGESDYETLKLVRDANIPPLKKYGREVPAPLERIIRRSLAKDPAERHQTAEDLGRELAEFMFEHGAVVSGYDIASLVRDIIEKQPRKERKTTEADLAAGQQIQKELNQLVSLEEMGNLDQFMTEVYGDISAEVVDEDVASGSEDPREWMDLGFGGDDSAPPTENSPPPPAGAEEGWQEGGLNDVARATQSMQAVEGPGTKKGAEQAKREAAKAKQRQQQEQRQRDARQQQQAEQRKQAEQQKQAERRRQQSAGASGGSGGRPQQSRAGKAQPQSPESTAPNIEPASHGGGQKRQAPEDDGGSNALILMLMLIVLVAAAAGAYFLVLN
jgi:serine/threonine-protein kinase